MDKQQNILKVKGLCKHFPVYARGLVRRVESVVKAVDDVSLELERGRTLGLVGESGCGKTTTCRSVLRALKPTSGQVYLKTNDHYVNLAELKSKQLRPLRRQMQMIFQDPFSSLNPRMTVGQIVGEPLVIHKIAKSSERKDRVAEMLNKVGLKSEHALRYPHAFSGGQRQRIGIARALILKPSLVVCDEAVSALDVSVQAQIINLLEDMQEEFELAYLFVAHDLSVVQHICDRVAVMYAGSIVEIGPTEEIFTHPRHPYTQALLAAVPYPNPDKKITFTLTGEPVDLADIPEGCSFAPRCPKKFDVCPIQKPQLLKSGLDTEVACHLYHSPEHKRSENKGDLQ